MPDDNFGAANSGGPPLAHAAPLRVAMFIQHYHPFVGGAERQLYALTRVLPSFNILPFVVTRRLPGPGFPPREMVAGAPVYRVSLRGGRALRSLSYTIGALKIVWRQRRRIDVLHAHELLSPTTTAVLAKLLIRRPVVAKVLGGGAHGEIAKLKATTYGRARLAVFRRLVDHFICVSDEIAAQLRSLGVPETRLVRIANGVDTEVFRPVPPEERARLRATLGHVDAPLVIYTGRLAPEKGMRLLAAAWKIVRERHPTAQLFILGEGPEREAFEQIGLRQTHLFGAQANLVAYLQAADVFVLPSQREGLSNSLLEAMSVGLACVATRVGGTPELVEHSVNGLLVDSGDEQALAAALSRALDDEALRQRLGAAARSFVVARYSLLTVCAALAKLYAARASK